MLGDTEVLWFESEPGIAVIHTFGGSVDDRWLAEGLTRDRLAAVGIRQARFFIDPTPDFRKTSAWTDIMAKAKRLIQSGNVQLLRNGYNNIVAHVVGDHGEYTSEISRDDPSSRAITQWTCECPWDQYAFQRTRQWKKYEARPCAHVLAAFWKSLSTPMDEDLTPDQAAGMGTGQALPGGGAPPMQSPMGGPFDGGTFNPDGTAQMNPTQPPMMPGMGAPTPLAAPGYDPSQMPPPPNQMAQPGQNAIIPPFPMDQSQMQLPVSVPGGRPGPYPANPMQQGGTLSKVAAVAHFHNGEDGMAPEQDQVVSRAMVYDPVEDILHVGNHDEVRHSDLLEHVPMEWYAHKGYISHQPYQHPQISHGYQWYDHPDEQYDNLHGLLNQHFPGIQDMDKLDDGEHWSSTLAFTVEAKKGDTFPPDTSARVEEDTMGQSEGREGAIDAGQWMNVPKGTNVVIVHQDPTTGWVECMMPLKGGPMTSYHVRFFIEPEKLTPLPLRENTPFQNPRR